MIFSMLWWNMNFFMIGLVIVVVKIKVGVFMIIWMIFCVFLEGVVLLNNIDFNMIVMFCRINVIKILINL